MSYQKLEVYKLAYDFAIKIYNITDKFPISEGELKQQIRKTASKIPKQIVEGASKKSLKAFMCNVNFAYAAAKEMTVLLKLAKDIEKLSIFQYETLMKHVDNISAKLYLLNKYLEAVEKRQSYEKYDDKNRKSWANVNSGEVAVVSS